MNSPLVKFRQNFWFFPYTTFAGTLTGFSTDHGRILGIFMVRFLFASWKDFLQNPDEVPSRIPAGFSENFL